MLLLESWSGVLDRIDLRVQCNEPFIHLGELSVDFRVSRGDCGVDFDVGLRECRVEVGVVLCYRIRHRIPFVAGDRSGSTRLEVQHAANKDSHGRAEFQQLDLG